MKKWDRTVRIVVLTTRDLGNLHHSLLLVLELTQCVIHLKEQWNHERSKWVSQISFASDI